MKKKVALTCIIAVGFFVLLLSGCKKLLDHMTPKPNDKANNCRIEKVTFSYWIPRKNEDDVLISDAARVRYNEYGDPVSIKYVLPGDGIFTNDKVFKYDKHHRLSVYLDGVPNSGSALFWHKYTYLGDYIIIDSTFEYATGDWWVNDVPDDAETTLYSITRYDLDYLGRVITERTTGSHNEITAYTYDLYGNLMKNGVDYSDKINLKRTNEVWMFLDRDYSLNSPVEDVSQYNQHNFPVRLNKMPQFIYDADHDYNEIVVQYDCRN